MILYIDVIFYVFVEGREGPAGHVIVHGDGVGDVEGRRALRPAGRGESVSEIIHLFICASAGGVGVGGAEGRRALRPTGMGGGGRVNW